MILVAGLLLLGAAVAGLWERRRQERMLPLQLVFTHSCPLPAAPRPCRLMNQGKLSRVGAGGRGDPFAYRSTPQGLDALQDIIINSTLA